MSIDALPERCIRDRRSRPAKRRVVAVIAVATLALAGCGSTESGTPQAAAGAAAAKNTSESPSETANSGDTAATESATHTALPPDSADSSASMVPAAPRTSAQTPVSESESTQPTSPPPLSTVPSRTPRPTTLTIPPSTTNPAATGLECLYDTWTMSNAVFASSLAELSGGAGTDAISGTATVTFNRDGTFATQYDQWTHEITAQGASGGAITVVRNGTDTGTFTATTDGVLTLQEMAMASILTMTVETPQGSHTSTQPPTEPTSSTVTFDCVAGSDIMTIVQDGYTVTMGRGAALG